jgi:hypothetical protein
MSLDVDSIFAETIDILNILLQSKSRARTNYYLPTVQEAESKLEWIVNTNFADDASTKDLKDKARRMLAEIETLKNQL